MSSHDIQTIYESPSFRAFADSGSSGSDHLLVTFDFWENGESGFKPTWERLLNFGLYGFSELHVSTSRKNWYQAEDTAVLVEELSAYAANFKRVTTMGSSMGGYGALLFSRAIGAGRVVSISPQYSMDPQKVPFEGRWASDVESLEFTYDEMHSGISDTARIEIMYDPFHEVDSKHVKLIRSVAPHARLLPFCFAGHPVTRVFRESGVLGEKTADFLHGGLSAQEFQRCWRSCRRSSTIWMTGYGLGQLKRGRLDDGIRALKQAFASGEMDEWMIFSAGSRLAEHEEHAFLGLSLLELAKAKSSVPPAWWEWKIALARRSVARSARSRVPPQISISMPSNLNSSLLTKPSIFGRIKRAIKRSFKTPLDKRPKVRRSLSEDPSMNTELVGPKGLPLGYFNMPKSGCSTIKNVLYYLEKGKWLANPLDIHLVVSRGQGLLLYEDFQKQRSNLEPERPYFVFTFVRHPGRRVYSAFIEKILTKHRYALAGLRKHLFEHSVFLHRGRRMLSVADLPELGEMKLDDLRHNFKEFLKFVHFNLKSQTKFPPNAHWTLQSARLDALRDHEKVQFIGKVENFVPDFEHVLKQVGIVDPELARKRFNEGPKPPFRYEDVLDDGIRSQIRTIYAADFERFGYSED